MGKETMKKVCILCGAPLRGGRKYCPACGKKKLEESRRASYERRKAGNQKKLNLVSVRKNCRMCGKEFTARSKRVQYCEECRKERAALASRKASAKTRANAQTGPKGKKAGPKDTLEMAMKRLAKVNEERKKSGLSVLTYGKAVQQGLI